MPNVIDAITPKIIAGFSRTLRESLIGVRLVNTDLSNEAKAKGDTVDVPLPSAVDIEDVTPANTPPAPTSRTISKVQVPLSHWKKNKGIVLTDKEMAQIAASEGFLPSSIGEAGRSLARFVNQTIFAQYVGIFGLVGTAGTTPFATTPAAAIAARKLLNVQLCPKAGRSMVLDVDAEANALALATMADADVNADGGRTKMEGEIGRRYGFDWFSDEDAIPTHTAGTGSGYLVNGTLAAGDTVVPVDTGSGTILVGDIITFAGSTQQYVVTAALSGGNISVSPGIGWTPDGLFNGVVPANNAAITLVASHVVNMAFHREAFALAMRMPGDGGTVFNGGSMIQPITDSVSGIPMRLEVSRQHKQTVWELDILFGCKLVRPELAVRVAG